MKFDFSKYKGKCLMCCKTKEEESDFRNIMKIHGMKWSNGNSYDVSYWAVCCGNIYFDFNQGVWKDDGSTLDGYIILNWEDFMEKQFTKACLKDGMVGIDRKGYKYIYLNNQFMDESGLCRLCPPEDLNDDLTVVCANNSCDIVKVCVSSAKNLGSYFSDANLEIIWQHPEEITEMTVTEIKEALGIYGELKIKES